MRRTRTAWVLAGLGAAWLLGAATASARPELPGEIQSVTEADCPPPCTICHTSALGGPGTITKAFGEAMFLNGLDPGDLSTVEGALASMEGSEQYAYGDTDGDGISDREELMNGFDPNPGGAQFCGAGADVPPSETYGCFARIAPSPRSSEPLDPLAVTLAGIAALALGRLARRRRG